MIFPRIWSVYYECVGGFLRYVPRLWIDDMPVTRNIGTHRRNTDFLKNVFSLQTYRSKFWNIFFPGFLLSVTCIIGTQGKPWKVFLILCKYIQANTGHGKLFRRWAVLFCYAAEIRISKYWIPYKNDHRHCTKEWILNKIIVNHFKDIVIDWLFNSSWQRIVFFLTSEFYISDVFHKISPKPISLEIRYPLRAIVVSLKPGLSAQKP